MLQRILYFFIYVGMCLSYSTAFTLHMMGGRRGKGELKQRLVGDKSVKNSSNNMKSNKSAVASLNQGRGQEITGVSLPSEGESLTVCMGRLFLLNVSFSTIPSLTLIDVKDK